MLLPDFGKDELTMKRSIKRLLSAVLTSAIVITAMSSVISAVAAEEILNVEAAEIGVITNPRTQPEANVVCPPGTKGEDGKRHLPVLVIVAGFNDLDYDSSYNWSDVFFGSGKETLKQYFRTMSHGDFVVEPAKESDGASDGVIHVKLNSNHWNDAASDYVNKETSAVSDAIKAAKDYIGKEDLALYDKNGSGAIDTNELMVAVLFAGYDYSSINKSTMKDRTKMSRAWFDSFSMSSAPVINDMKIPFYITSAEKKLVTENGRVIQTSFGAIAHESLHYIGIPDYYAYTNTSVRSGVNAYEWDSYKPECLSIMARPHGVLVDDAGNPDVESTSPYSLDPWAKIRLGWATYETVEAAQEGTISKTVNALNYNDVENDKEIFLRVNIPGNADEYYLIENRQLRGYDAGMKYDPRFIDSFSNGGIVIWHIDDSVLNAYIDKNQRYTYLQSMVINNTFHRPAIMPVFVENDNTAWNKSCNFLGNDVNFRAGIHSAESLALYGLSKIDLVCYNGSDLNDYPYEDREYVDRVCDREYTGISVTVPSNSDSMEIAINFNDNDHSQKMKPVYLEKTDAVFSNTKSFSDVLSEPYVFAYEDINEYLGYENWPGVKMERVRDNIFVAYVPENYNLFIFNTGTDTAESPDPFYDENAVPKDNENIYSADGWSVYQKKEYSAAQKNQQMRGDINMDGNLNIKDVTMLQRHLAEFQYLSRLQLVLSDADSDGHINITDCTTIQMKLAEMYSFTHPCGKKMSAIRI